MEHEGRDLGVVRSRIVGRDKPAAFYPGALPDRPEPPAGPGARRGRRGAWLQADYEVMDFSRPPR